MARFLFATWEGGGHVQPMLLAAQGLIRQGHQALALSDACNARDAAALSVPFQPWRHAPSRPDRSPESDPLKDWLATSPLEVIGQIVDGVMCGPAARYAVDVCEAIDAFDPAVVVSQELLFGAMAGAEAKRRALALFVANIWSLPTLDGAPPFGAGLPPAQNDDNRELFTRIAAATRGGYQSGLAPLNDARADLGLAPLADVFDQLKAARRVLLATSRAFDFEQALPESFRYVGPYLADPAWTEAWSAPWPADDARPLVLVSFSTMYQNQEPVLRRVIDALGTLPIRGLVTLGPVLSAADFDPPPNVTLAARVPHSQVLAETAVMVTHVGHASALRPLIAGVPLLCLPLGRDQSDNAARVVDRGAGVRLAADASAETIAAGIRTILDDPAYRRAARAFGDRIARDARDRSAEHELTHLAQLEPAP